MRSLPLPGDAHVFVADDVVADIEQSWQQHHLDDHALHDGAAQEHWRDELARLSGGRWLATSGKVARLVDTPPHAAVVRSVGTRPSQALLAALSVSLGHLADPYRTSWSRVLQLIPPRAAGRDIDAAWHTDSPGWIQPNDLTCLLCVTPARHGGATELLPWPLLAAEVGKDRELAGHLRTRPVPWVLDDALGRGVVYEPVAGPGGLRFMRQSLERSAAAHPAHADWLIWLGGRIALAADSAPVCLSVRLERGDVLIFDNRRCLHRRGKIEVGAEAGRTLIRARLCDLAWERDADPLT